MNKTIETSSLLAALFIVFIFWGDVWLIKITLPLSMLLVPLILLKRSRFILPIPEAAIPLLCLGTIIAIQCIIYRNNPAFKFKSDLATWLPLTYAGITILALQNIKMARILLLRALTVGGLLTSIIMLAMIIFAPSNMFLFPGQDAAQVEETYAKTLANDHMTPIVTKPLQKKPTPSEPTSSSNITTPTTVETPITVPAINAHQPAPPAGREFVLINNTEKIFYDLKKKSKNFLEIPITLRYLPLLYLQLHFFPDRHLFP
ncbi:hypothetical protein [Brucella tritici]|uniref:hypothetical protein n=1 Tax=Brucella tritici TaxID=94626 RepID=UPI0015917757|nr:hypothetical protein [Brucella tritici]